VKRAGNDGILTGWAGCLTELWHRGGTHGRAVGFRGENQVANERSLLVLWRCAKSEPDAQRATYERREGEGVRGEFSEG